MVYRWLPLIVLTGLAGIFSSCEKAMPLEGDGLPQDDISIGVKDTLLAAVIVSGDTLQNVGAYKLTFSVVKATWDAAAGEPVFLEIYKRYPGGGDNFLKRIFGGGAGVNGGDTVYYRAENGQTDTVSYSSQLTALILKSDQDKQTFHFGVAARYGLGSAGARVFTGGKENNRIFADALYGGGNTRSMEINHNDRYTANNVVTLRAKFDTTGVDTFYYFRFSGVSNLRFDLIFAMDSALKAAGSGSAPIPFLDGLELNPVDSTVLDVSKALAGKFGGKFSIPAQSLPGRVDSLAGAGEAGWVEIVKKDTLPSGPGKKWVFLTARNWRAPLYENIDIAPYGGELVPDFKRPGSEWRINSVEGKACLVERNGAFVPFTFNTFGDTTFEDSVFVWLATRNLSSSFLVGEGEAFSFSSTDVSQNQNELELGVEWPDAVLETPPVKFTLGVSGVPDGLLTPDYDRGYRVSPFYLLYYISESTKKYYRAIIDRPNTELLNRMVKKGSILGYGESQLNRFKEADSIFIIEGGAMKKVPAPGWFNYVPLDSLASDNTYTPQHLVDFFGKSDSTIVNKDGLYNSSIDGYDFYGIYSAYFYSADNLQFQSSHALFQAGTGVKLYHNPFRGLPYFILSNGSGSKEFVLVAYTRGKYFKEPRVFVSSFSSPFKTVWDKTPPHAAWAPSSDPKDQAYAPMYYVNKFNPLDRTVSDLSTTADPNVFDVSLSPLAASSGKFTAVRDVGFGKITRVMLGFNYAADFLDLEPATGSRRYKTKSIYLELDERQISQQSFLLYTFNKVGYKSYALDGVAFNGINAKLWRTGVWDMWVETADDLGNIGVAPTNDLGYSLSKGILSVRQIQIK